MSRTRLQDLVISLYERNQVQLDEIFNHPDFEQFQTKHELKLPKHELIMAFTHTSFAHEYQVPHQELLEFLGDSVLQLILTDELYRRFPQENEGRLSKLRSALVNEKTLSTMAKSLGLNELILVGKGESKRGLMNHEAVLADTIEALLGQIYRHHGFDKAKSLFLNWINQFVPNAFAAGFLDDFDAKSQLQEAVLAKYKKLPRYTAEAKGEVFEVKLWINDQVVALGDFVSKKNGEKQLAQDALKKGLV